MKAKKLLCIIIAITICLSLPFSVFAYDFSKAEQDLDFLNEHSGMLSYYYALRLDALSLKLEEIINSADANKEDIEKTTNEISELRKQIENCIDGKHIYDYIGADCYPPLCTGLAVCRYCTYQETVISGNGYREQHSDKNKDDICDDCNRTMPYVNCDHICHSENLLVQRIIMPVLRAIWRYFDVQEFCECGTYH